MLPAGAHVVKTLSADDEFVLCLHRLISASVGSVVYYGFQCHTNPRTLFLSLCFITGLAGSVLPFMDWFNKPKHKASRFTTSHSMAMNEY